MSGPGGRSGDIHGAEAPVSGPGGRSGDIHGAEAP